MSYKKIFWPLSLSKMQWLITPGAKEFLTEDESKMIVRKYCEGDWGDTSKTDKKMNDQALEPKERVLAKYIVRDTDIFIITDYGHEVTTIILADEY